MFKFLDVLGNEVSSRYQTVVRDIKSKSNSFYDSYLDLQEAFIKAILDSRGFEYDSSRTCGFLLRGAEVTSLFQETLGVPKDIFEQIQARTLKVNHHKHQKQKHILADSVIVYMEGFHQFTRICCGSEEEFDPIFFREIFGEYERLNLSLKSEKESLVSELDELVREKRLSEEQFKQYEQALISSQSASEELSEQNDALLKEISSLKSIKLALLDQKLNRTIDMLNDLQEYLAESRAVSLAVGYTVVGKERIGSYIDLAREELGAINQSQRLPPHLESPSPSPRIDRKEEPDTSGAVTKVPPNILDAVTTKPEPEPTISEHVGEPALPYLYSNAITVLPDDRYLAKTKRGGLLSRSFALLFTSLVFVSALLLEKWFKLLSIVPFLNLVYEILEMVWYLKNSARISNRSPWIMHRAEIEINDEANTTRVYFPYSSATEGGMTRFITGTWLPMVLSVLQTMAFPVLCLWLFLAKFVGGEPDWSSLTMLVAASIAAAFVFPQLILSLRKPRPPVARYVSFDLPNGSLVCDTKESGLERWTLLKK